MDHRLCLYQNPLVADLHDLDQFIIYINYVGVFFHYKSLKTKTSQHSGTVYQFSHLPKN